MKANLQDLLLRRLQALHENTLSREYLVPLFRNLGYERADFVGGPYEKGKDIVCWGQDRIGKIELAVIQVKRLRAKVSTRTADSFSDLINQLQQAIESPVAHIDGISYLPNCTYFVTPYPIDVRALESRIQGYQALRARNVRIIDGPELASLLQKHLPAAVEKLIGHHIVVQHQVAASLSNTILLDALKSRYPKRIESFYCDLEFVFGRLSQSSVFGFKLKPVGTLTIEASDELLDEIRQLSQYLAPVIKEHMLMTTNEEIDAQKARQHESHYQETFQDHFYPDEAAGAKPNERRFKFTNQLESLATVTLNTHDLGADKAMARASVASTELRTCIAILEEPGLSLKRLRAMIHGARSMRKRYADVFRRTRSPETRTIDTCLNILETTYTTFSKALNEFTLQPYKVQIDGRCLYELLQTRMERIRSEIKVLNQGSFSTDELRSFVTESAKTFEIVGEVLNCRVIREELFLDTTATSDDSPLCLSIPINRLFDTGLNLAIFGDAGAGKTTTLQIYAKRQIESPSGGMALFVPLSAITNWIGDSTENDGMNNAKALFAEALDAYLNNALRSTWNQILAYYRGKRQTLLLDGVDEAIRKAPWILAAIKAFSEQYTGVQIIISSRQSGEYLAQIPFFGVTIRPFSTPQRDYFIEKWFENGNKKHAAQIVDHLGTNPNIAEVIRNPLLATILCVLAEHDIPLPDREIRLYEERRRLLMGDYDIQKQIRRVLSPGYLLEFIAERLAYELHRAGKRYDAPNRLHQLAQKHFALKFTSDVVTTAVNELADPCNILVPMTNEGDLGFGHLRFQEYFAACELARNRDIRLAPLARASWWRGALSLYAQKADDLDGFINEVIAAGDVAKTIETFNQMMSGRSEEESLRYDALIRNAIDAEERAEEAKDETEGGLVGEGPYRFGDDTGYEEDGFDSALIEVPSIDDVLPRSVRNRRGSARKGKKR